MATGIATGAAAEVERLRALVADQHRRLRVACDELAPIGGAQVIAPPMPSRCGKPRLARAALARLIEQAQARSELMDSALGDALWAYWPEPRPTIPVLRPTPGLPAYGLRSLPGLPNLVLALFLRAPAEIEAAIARALAEQRSGEPFLPIFLTCQPDFSTLREQRLAFEYFPFVLDESAPAPEPSWAAYLIRTLELTMRRWGVRQIVTL